MKSDIDFNNGFITALVLFYAHKTSSNEIVSGDMRMNGGSDHLYNMQVPKRIPQETRTKVNKLMEDAFKHRLTFKTESGIIDKIFDKSKEIVQELIKENPGRGMEFLISDKMWDEHIKNGSVSWKYIEQIKEIDKRVFGLKEVVVNYP